jgi:hypothetical protein
MSANPKRNWNNTDRRDFIGGSDARIIMGQDEKALIRLWQEKRGEVGPEDLSANLIVQLGLVTEDLNRQWYERNTGNAIKDVQCRVRHPVIRWMAATLDGVVAGFGGGLRGQVHAAVVVLGGVRGREVHGPAPAQHVGDQYPDGGALHHHRWGQMGRDLDRRRPAVSAPAPHCGEEVLALRVLRRAPSPVRGRTARPRIEAVRTVDMGSSNSWAEFAVLFRSTRPAFLEHERARTELKGLMPEDAKEAFGHGIRAKRSKSGAVSFDLVDGEANHAPVQ